MSFGFLEPWHVFLPREGGHVVSIMGSGGKTTLLRTFAGLYAAEGIPSVLATTTRSEVLEGVAAGNWAELDAAGWRDLPPSIYVHTGLDDEGKWRGLEPERIDDFGGILPDRVVLVEVDGAAKLPLKLYRTGEPVWPQRTSLAIVVMGIGAVGGKAGQYVHRWGQTAAGWSAGLPAHTVLTWQHAGDLLLEPGGYLAQVPAGVPCVLALTGLAVQDDSIGLFEFVARATADPALPLVLFCHETPEGLQIRTACAEPDEPSP